MIWSERTIETLKKKKKKKGSNYSYANIKTLHNRQVLCIIIKELWWIHLMPAEVEFSCIIPSVDIKEKHLRKIIFLPSFKR